jgi:alpha-galactosidase
MAMHCLAVERATRIRHVGLCHGVQGTARNLRMIVAMLDEPADVINRHFDRPFGHPKRNEEWAEWLRLGQDPDLTYTCAGINHMAFYLSLRSGTEDLYPRLWKVFDCPHMLRFDPVRFALFRRLGYFMTETSGHMAEYVPYFLKDADEINAHALRVSSYLQTCREQDAAYTELREQVRNDRGIVDTPYTASHEYAARIVNAVTTNTPFVFNGNVHNQGGALISNLPGDACVEVPCTATREGIRPGAVGELPPQCAALIRPNVSVQDLAVRGILDGSRDNIRQAVMMDPNTASQVSLTTIDELVDAMFDAHADRLPDNLK